MRKVTVGMKREMLGKNYTAGVVIIILVFVAACKERWFKLKANFLFYYRLNEFGGVAKNEVSYAMCALLTFYSPLMNCYFHCTGGL